MAQKEIDAKNALFWDELCGSSLAQSLGIKEMSLDGLQRFDHAYLRLYPYLSDYVQGEELATRKVLEIGLGYGTLGQMLAERGCHYYGLDIAEGPVRMMGYRLSMKKKEAKGRLQIGSILNAPYRNGVFDFVYSIGCLHHTGDLARGIEEIHRILRPQGKAIIMLYNKNSFRLRIELPMRRVLGLLSKRGVKHRGAESIRAMYDTNSEGNAAPHTDFVSKWEVRRLFRKFSCVRIDTQNFDNCSLRGRTVLKRERLLDNVAKIVGLDLYIVARK